MKVNLNLHLTGKQKQALLESNLPGISCSTGMVNERLGDKTGLSFKDHSKSRMPKKTQSKKQRKLRCFILLNGSKKWGAYNTTRLGKTWIDSLTFYPKNEELTLKKLDSLKREFDRLFTNDLKLMALLKDSAKFQSNRTYFSAFYDYLDNYQRIFIDEDILSKVLSKHGNEAEIISLGDYYYVSLDKIDSTFYIDKKKNYLELETQLEERADKANFIASIMLFPLDKISDLFDYEE